MMIHLVCSSSSTIWEMQCRAHTGHVVAKTVIGTQSRRKEVRKTGNRSKWRFTPGAKQTSYNAIPVCSSGVDCERWSLICHGRTCVAFCHGCIDRPFSSGRSAGITHWMEVLGRESSVIERIEEVDSQPSNKGRYSDGVLGRIPQT